MEQTRKYRRYAYRILSNVQRAAVLAGEDILAKVVDAGNDIADQVLNNGANSMWISLGWSFAALYRYLKKFNEKAMIVRVDVTDLEYIDISTKAKQAAAGVSLGGRKGNYPIRSREIVIQNRIPIECVTIVSDNGELFESIQEVNPFASQLLADRVSYSDATVSERVVSLRSYIDGLAWRVQNGLDKETRIEMMNAFLALDRLVPNKDWGSVSYC